MKIHRDNNSLYKHIEPHTNPFVSANMVWGVQMDFLQNIQWAFLIRHVFET
jgi:hypothetical protein